MKKYFLLLLLNIPFTLLSQQQKSLFWDHIRYGGGISLSFGSQTSIGISPSAIYDFENGFSLGSGVTYVYNKVSDFTTNVYGISVISLYQIPKVNIQISGEFEQSFASQKNNFDSINTSFPALYFGAAYNNGKFALGVRYDALYDKNKNIYASPISPIIRFYF